MSLLLSEDAYKGEAQYAITVDGKQVINGASVTASHAAGQQQSVNLTGILAAGAHDIEEQAIVSAPVSALLHLAEEIKADLLVVGNLGVGTVAGRLLGSVPDTVARKAKVDILIVHTVG